MRCFNKNVRFLCLQRLTTRQRNKARLDTNMAATLLAIITASLLSLTMSSIRLLSCWSKAGVGTSSVLEYNPGTGGKKRPRIVLDLGATPIYEDAIRANTVFITHGHLDHVGAIFSHARAHSVAYGGCVGVALYYWR